MKAQELAERAGELTAGEIETAMWQGMAGRAVVDVPRKDWVRAVTAVRDDSVLDLGYFDLLTAVDHVEDGFEVVLQLWSVRGRHGLELRTRCPRDDADVPSLAGVFAGAAWHERGVWEMFGISFAGHPALTSLLLPDGFDGRPLRKDFVLAARVAKPWPGAIEPGQSSSGQSAPRAGRRRVLPPGVPSAGSWGPAPPAATPAATPPEAARVEPS